MLDYEAIDLDPEQVRRQMSDELGRTVSDVELQLWLRECGFYCVQSIWYADSIARQKLPIYCEVDALPRSANPTFESPSADPHCLEP